MLEVWEGHKEAVCSFLFWLGFIFNFNLRARVRMFFSVKGAGVVMVASFQATDSILGAVGMQEKLVLAESVYPAFYQTDHDWHKKTSFVGADQPNTECSGWTSSKLVVLYNQPSVKVVLKVIYHANVNQNRCSDWTSVRTSCQLHLGAPQSPASAFVKRKKHYVDMGP